MKRWIKTITTERARVGRVRALFSSPSVDGVSLQSIGVEPLGARVQYYYLEYDVQAIKGLDRFQYSSQYYSLSSQRVSQVRRFVGVWAVLTGSRAQRTHNKLVIIKGSFIRKRKACFAPPPCTFHFIHLIRHRRFPRAYRRQPSQGCTGKYSTTTRHTANRFAMCSTSLPL